MHSAIYQGTVFHRRYTPKSHRFSYQLYMFYICLDELEEVLSTSGLLSKKRFSFLSYKREDYHGDPAIPLDETLRCTVEQQLGFRPEGRICMLTNLRVLGFNMNPLTTYYCFDKSGDKLQALVAEVTNTPWNERRAYVISYMSDNSEDGKRRHRIQKDFTVSPFNPLNMEYRWRSNVPGESLSIHIENYQQEQAALELESSMCDAEDITSGNKVFEASLTLSRKALSQANLRRALLSYPLMTFKVILSIYWQALRLYLKGVPFLGKNKVKIGAVDVASDQRHSSVESSGR